MQPAKVRHVRVTGDVVAILEMGKALQSHASSAGIHNVMSDNGYQELVILTLFGLTKLRREGNDAIDGEGREYELKTVGRISSEGAVKKSLGVTTEHTLTMANIERYRAGYLWIIAIFRQTVPESIWEITPAALEPIFAKWEEKLGGMGAAGNLAHINNPKVPMWFVERYGLRVWPEEADELPASAQRQLGLGEV
jgi:hypothetical protein